MTESTATLTVGVPKETFPGECRVALVPASIDSITKAGVNVVMESGAGVEAGYPDSEYESHGVELLSRADVFDRADIILQVRSAGANRDGCHADFEQLHSGQTLIGSCDPLGEPQLMADIAGRKITCLSLEMLPRITRAQSMDVLSSMASIAGYKAVLMAAEQLPRMFPMMMTAAGTITPARVFVMGAGVAGLQAIATARRLGGVVWAYDIRPAVKEEVVSLGAKFLEIDIDTGSDGQSGGYAKEMTEDFLRRQSELMTEMISESNVVITTAAVPGRKAPRLVTAEMVEKMPAGSVIVDLAAESGGNCELTKANETIVVHGVKIIGTINVPATVPFHSSQMYSKNISTFLLYLINDGKLNFDLEDEIVSGALITQDGEVIHPRVRTLLDLAPLDQDEDESAGEEPANEESASNEETANEETANEETANEESAGENMTGTTTDSTKSNGESNA